MKIKDLSLWEAFYLAAEEKSFTKAAAKMKIGLPFLSKKISALEEELKTKLFQRTTRKISLTDAGRGILAEVTGLLEDLGELENRFEDRENLSGTIRFTCPLGIGHRLLTPLIVEFSRLHPQVKFEVDHSDRIVDIIEEQMDFAIRIQEPEGANFIFKKIAVNNYVFCASPKYLKENKPVIRRLEDLHYHRILMLDAYSEYQIKNRKSTLRDFAKDRFITGVSGIFLTELALHHGGVAVRSTWDVNTHLKSGRLVRILENYELEGFGDIYIVVPDRKYMSFRVRKFIDFISEKAKSWD